MRKVAVGCGILIALCGPASFGQKAAHFTEAKQAIIQLEQRWLRSLDDPAALQSILADDFIHVLPNGFITKNQQIAYLKTHPMPPANRHFEDLAVRVYGDTAVANGVVVTEGKRETRRMLFTDVFVKRRGRWQAVNAQEVPEAEQER